MGQEEETRSECGPWRAVLAVFSLATFLLLLVFGALPSVFDPARAYADEAPSDSARVIRVAYVQQEPMSPADESGAFVGYTYEYFERLAQYTGWSYEFVPVEGSGPAAYKTLRDLLGAGDADVAVGLMARGSRVARLHARQLCCLERGAQNRCRSVR